MASNGIAVISGSAGSVIVHKLLSDGVVVLGEDKAASVSVSGSLCVTGSFCVSGSTQITGSASFLETIDGQVDDISNHLLSGLSNVSSSTDSPTTGSIFVFDGTSWVASGSSNPSNHASTHVASGSDVINGDRLEIDFVPSVGYVPDSTIPEALSTIELAAHLAGIANAISSAASGGEVNTASNIGTGEGTFAQKVAFDLQFKSLTTGSNIELSSSASEINIALADQISLTAITASFLGDLIGNVTGNVLGDLTGDVTGNVLGDVTGDVVGNLTGNVLGNLTGDVTGNVLGNVIGNLTGNVLGDLIGNVTGQVSDISNHTIGELSNVSSSADSATIGDVLYWDGSTWTTVDSGSVGESNTASNLGTGEGLFAQKVGADLQFKSLTSGSNIEISASVNEVDVALADQVSLTGVTASFLGDLIGNVTGNLLGNVVGDVVGNLTGNVLGNVLGDLTGNVLGDLVGNVTGQVSDISNHTIGELSNVSSSADSATIGDMFVYDGTNWVPTASAMVGENNTASNLGSGEGIFAQKVGVDLQFKSLTSGSNLVLSSSANKVDISLASQISVTGITASFVGDLVGDVTGNVLGGVTGDVVGNLTGNVLGNLTGNVTGNVLGDVVGNVVGDLTGNVLGDVVGDLTGNVTGQVSDISNHTIGELSNVSSSADSATLGDVLYWDGSAWTTVDSGSVGESNTASNLGTGQGLFAQKVGDDLQFRSLQSGSNIELSSSATEVTISLADVISLTSISASAITASNFVGGTFSGLFIGSGSISGSDHGQLTGLGDDDHLQYLFLNGRAGGQTAIGGTAAGDALVLSASSNAGGGVIETYHPIRINYAEGNTTPVEQSGIVWEPTFTTAGSFPYQLIRNDADITYTTLLYIYSTILDRSFHTSNAAAGFQAFTLFNALPTIRNGTSNDLVQMLVLNDGGVHERRTSGTSTTPQHITVSGAPQLRTSIAGATMTWTAGATGLAWAPKFSTVAGSTVNMGTLAAVSVQAPAAALFQPSAGVENITNIYGLNFLAHTNTVSGEIAVVRSAMTAAASRYFLRNTGGAQSNFGGGSLFNCGFVQILADNTSLSLGAAGGDVQINWNGSALEYDPLSGDDLRWTFGTNAHTLQSSNFGTSSELRMGFDRFAFGQTSAVGNQVGIFVAPARSTSVAGGWSDFLLTQAANLTVNHAMSQVFGWTINAPSMTIGGGGSVTDAGALLVGGNVNSGTNRYGLYILSNPSGGGGVNHSLRVAGSALFDDEIEIDGDLNHDGTNVGFYGTAPVAQSSAYTPSNVATDRSYDANSTTLDEIADVLGTLIADLQATGLIG